MLLSAGSGWLEWSPPRRTTRQRRWGLPAVDPSHPASDRRRLLDQRDVFGPGPLRPLSFGVRHALPFLELFVGHPDDAGRVKKHVLAGAGVDKPEALIRES